LSTKKSRRTNKQTTGTQRHQQTNDVSSIFDKFENASAAGDKTLQQVQYMFENAGTTPPAMSAQASKTQF